MRHLQPHRLADDPLKRLEVSSRRPDLKLGVAPAVELDDDVFASIVDFKPRNGLTVAAVETFGDAEN